MENNQRSNYNDQENQIISSNLHNSFMSLNTAEMFNQQFQEEQQRIPQHLYRMTQQRQRNHPLQQQNPDLLNQIYQVQAQPQVEQDHHFFVLDFSSAMAKYQLVYFLVLVLEILYGAKVPNVCISWMGWYVIFGSCWSRNNTNGCLLIVSEAIKLVIVGWGLCIWVSQPLNLLFYLFLLLNVDSIVRIPVMLCTSCIVCVCASRICFLCIKIKLQLKSKNQKKNKFLQQLKKIQKTVIKNSSISTFDTKNLNNLQQMSDQLPIPKSLTELINSSQNLNPISQSQSLQKYQCPICLLNFQTTYVQVQCSHKFHYDCIKAWLQTTSTCPICRKQLY